MKLYVIRHGETTGDLEDRYGGAYDDGLSLQGHHQCQQLAEELAAKGIQTIFTSSLKRAQQTAEYLQKATGATLTIEPHLRERNQYGPLTGLTKTEAKATHPQLVENLKDRLFTAPGAESYADFATRITKTFNEISKQSQTTAIVWHGGGMRILFRDILKLGELEKIGDCCWVELERHGNHFHIDASQRLSFAF